MQKQGRESFTGRKSPLAAIEENDKSFKRTGPGQGTVTVKTREARVRIEPGNCLSLWMGVDDLPACRKLSHLDLLLAHHDIPGPCKFARPHSNGIVLLSEMSLGEPGEAPAAFNAAKFALEAALTMPASGRSKRSIEIIDPAGSDPAIQETLDSLPHEVVKRAQAWATSVDTSAQFQRIRIEAIGCDGLACVRLETPCERMTKPEGEAAQAVGAFLLEANARTRLARFSLKPDAEKSHVRPVVESVMPVALFSPARAVEAVRRILAGATRVRQELSMLTRSDIASAYVSG